MWIGAALALLSAASSGFSVVLVGRYSKASNPFNVSLVIACVGLAVLWPLALLATNFGAVNLEGIALLPCAAFFPRESLGFFTIQA
jgi:hypothetical protein